MTVTKCDPDRRLIHELDGRNAVERYCELIGVRREDVSHFLSNPLGLAIEENPGCGASFRTEVIRCFACAVLEGMTLNLMEAQDIVENAKKHFRMRRPSFGVPPRCDSV